MGFLIKTAFWFSLVLLLLPISPEGTDPEATVDPLEAVFAARAAISDVSSMCDRQPDVCETGRAAVQTIGVRARESARIAYELLDDQFGQTDPDLTTGTVPAAN